MNSLGTGRAALIFGFASLAAACADTAAPVQPVASPSAPKAAGTVYVIVQRGQSLDQITRVFHASKDEVIAANNLKPPYALKPGTMLAVPRAAADQKELSTVQRQAVTKPHPAVTTQAHPQHDKAKASAPEIVPLD